MTKSLEMQEDVLRKLFASKKIAPLAELKAALGTPATMTVFRRLTEMEYLTSYSHRGAFYTLRPIAQFDDQGLWRWRSVCFSRDGTLVDTARRFVDEARAGWTAAELEPVLHVEVKHALVNLHRRRLVHREDISGVYVYVSIDADVRRAQILMRRRILTPLEAGVAAPCPAPLEELRAAIVLFYSLLDEKQRRLYAGLEAHKVGHGGDQAIARLLGLDPHTVAKGRAELFNGDVDRERIRKRGGGRKRLEKKTPDSSSV